MDFVFMPLVYPVRSTVSTSRRAWAHLVFFDLLESSSFSTSVEGPRHGACSTMPGAGGGWGASEPPCEFVAESATTGFSA